MGLEKENKGLVVKEPNLFIEAIHQLSKAEQVIWFYALTKTKFFRYGKPDRELTEEDIEEMKKQRISITAYTVMDLNELRREFPDYFEANDIAYYRKVLERMGAKNLFKINTDHYIKTMEELGYGYMVEGLKRFKKKKEIDYHAISTISQVILAKDGTLAIIFSPDIAPILLELKKRYTLYDFEIILRLKSKYSRILYRLFKEKLGLKQTSFKISVEELQNILNTKKAYRNYIHLFNSKILQPAVKEINEKTDLKVEVRAIRQSRGGKIVGFEFKVEKTISSKGDIGKLIETLSQDKTLEVSPKELAEALLSLERVNPATALWFILHYPEGEPRLYAWEHIKMTEGNTKIRYPDKFLESLITDKKEELKWLLDQRVKDTIRDELRKIIEKSKGEDKPKAVDKEMEKLLNRFEEIKPLIRLYYDQVANYFDTENLNEFINGLIEKEDKERLEELIAFVETLEKASTLQRKLN